MFGLGKKEDKEEDTCIESFVLRPEQAKEFLKDLQKAHDKLIEEEQVQQGKK